MDWIQIQWAGYALLSGVARGRIHFLSRKVHLIEEIFLLKNLSLTNWTQLGPSSLSFFDRGLGRIGGSVLAGFGSEFPCFWLSSPCFILIMPTRPLKRVKARLPRRKSFGKIPCLFLSFELSCEPLNLQRERPYEELHFYKTLYKRQSKLGN